MSTARDLIAGSLRLLGAIASGETASSQEETDALSALNDMLDSWSNERLTIYQIIQEKFTLIPGQGSYTIGPTGTDFVTTRPMKLESATIENQSVTPLVEYPLEMLNSDRWEQIKVKNLQSQIPTQIFYNDGWPNSNVILWPIPSVANKVVLYSWKPLTSFVNATDTVSFPPGYQRALRYNLAIELAPEYEKSVSAETASIAAEAKGNIKRTNIKPLYLDIDSAIARRMPFNIYRGE